MNTEKTRLFAALHTLLAHEYNCDPADFTRAENVLTVSALRDGRRCYGSDPYFFSMVTTGGNAVITADTCLHPFLENWMQDRCGHWLFEQPNTRPLEAELNRFGYALKNSYHMFLPAAKAEVGTPDFAVRWFEDGEILPFYGDPRFPNAICAEPLPHRPDRLVVCAYDGETIMGMAGCSQDAPGWLQIGIDVLPAYRSRGVGAGLVALMPKAIEERGEIPFYGTSLSNYHSWNIAIRCGFRPAWVEIGAKKL